MPHGQCCRYTSSAAARLAKVTAADAKVAAAAYGVPLPIPALPGGTSTQEIVDSMIEEIGSIVEEKLEENQEAFDAVQTSLTQCEVVGTMYVYVCQSSRKAC